MRRSKGSVKRLEELEDRRKSLMIEISNINDVEKDLDCVLWKKLELKESDKFNEIEDKLFNFQRYSARDIDILLSERKKIIEVMAIRNCVAEKSNFENELIKVKEQIRDYKDKHK